MAIIGIPMHQQSFTAEDFEKYRNKTRKEVFLEEMDQIIGSGSLTTALLLILRVSFGH